MTGRDETDLLIGLLGIFLGSLLVRRVMRRVLRS